MRPQRAKHYLRRFVVVAFSVTCAACVGLVLATPVQAAAPVLNQLPQPDITVVESPAGSGSATVSWAPLTATDEDGTLTLTCTPSSGLFTVAGSPHTVSCSATDSEMLSVTDSFTVTVTAAPPPPDTTPPVVTVPAPITVEATGAGGAAVTFSPAPSAVDAVDGPRPVDCAPTSGSTFPVGSTTVTCSASDLATPPNTGSETFVVTVQDPAAPTVTVPASTLVEANGPGGSIVNYGPVSALDQNGAPLVPTCTPASGSRFPLGTTTVTCSATYSFKTGSAAFTITVRDTTRPVLRVPGPLELKSAEPVPATAPAVQSWFRGVGASDLVDPDPTVVVGLPAVFPLGVTTVPVTATDDAGNQAIAAVRVTVSSDAGVAPSSTPTPDLAPPGNATRVKAKAGHRSVSIRWKNPGASDFDRIEIIRTPGKNGNTDTVVYKGKGTSFTDRRLAIGTEYRYLLAAYDGSGNRSAGVAVVVVGQAELLFSPAEGATVTRAPMLRWARVPGANYYNVQLFRDTRRGPGAAAASTALRKVLSTWPVRTRFQLKSSWTFEGRRFQLEPGRYVWFVWPGLGPRAAGRYGDVIGESTFVVKKRR